jgi:hypothetical protein
MAKLALGFLLGAFATGILIDRGVNLPERLRNLINTGEIQRLADDIWNLRK